MLMMTSPFKNSAPQAVTVAELWLDPRNPRLGREHTRQELTQEQVLELMREWTLDELAVSFLESGFWIQEALLCVREAFEGTERLVVVEGNRRLAALKLLFAAKEGAPISQRWAEIAASGNDEDFARLEQVPYLEAHSRQSIQAYLGFRHVTGIKEWAPAEKAEFISKLIDEQGMTYQEVMRKIGSKTPTVRQNYIAYRILLQMEDDERIELDQVEERFSVLFLSLRTQGVQSYLNIDIQADPDNAKVPVPREQLDHLVRFSTWLFGTKKRLPVLKDSRQVDQFGLALENPEAVRYLETAKNPTLDTAYRLAGGDEAQVSALIEDAYYSVEQALGTVHHHRGSERLEKAVKHLGDDVMQLLRIFPHLKIAVLDGDGNSEPK